MPINYTTKGMKRPNEPVEWTPERQREYIKCAKDIFYFAENYYTVVEEKRGKHIIKLFDYQKEMINNFINNRFNCVLSARQMGKTTCSALYLLWYAMFDLDKTIAILANKEFTAKSIIDEVKLAWRELPDWLKPGVEKYDQLEVKFDNGSRIMAGATSEDSFRGESISLLFCDEFAFVPDNVASAYWASAFPTISQGGRVILVSTPRGSSGLFYEIYNNAINKKNTFQHIKINWERHPDRNPEWKENTLQAIGKVRFAQEYSCSFSGSTNTLVEGNILSTLKWEEPSYTPDHGYEIWKQPINGHIYGLGVDVAKGSNSDYSIVNVFDITMFLQTGKYEQVALYRRNDVLLFDFIEKVYNIGKYYNNGVIVVENNQLGDVVCKSLHNDKEYENLFFDYERSEHGINANVKTKPLALSYLKQDIETGNMKINSDEMVKELGYFEESRPGIFAAKNAAGCHDDVISSAYWVSYLLRSRYMDDVMFYAGIVNRQSDKSRPESEQDEEILRNFNKYIRPTTDQDRFRKSLSR